MTPQDCACTGLRGRLNVPPGHAEGWHARRASRLFLVLGFVAVAGAAEPAGIAWTPDPEDDPCILITAPADPEDAGWLMWRAAMCGDGLAAQLPPVRRLGGVEVRNDAEAFAVLARAWQPHTLPAPIPLPASGLLLLAALAAFVTMKRMKR